MVRSGPQDAIEERVVLELSAPGEALELPLGTITIGRGADCFLRVDDPMVSRQHAELRVGVEVVLVDLGSRNGTYVNGERLVGSRVLHGGDTIRLGARSFRLRAVIDSESDGEEITLTMGGEQATLLGVAAIQPTCSVCGSSLPANARKCPRCAASWPAADRARPTTEQPALPAAAPELLGQGDRGALPVRYISPSLTVEAVAVDLSERGVFVATSRLDRLGVSCTLLISARPDQPATATVLAANRAMSFRGFVRNVVHRGNTGMGVEFESLDEKQRAWIEQRLAETRGPWR